MLPLFLSTHSMFYKKHIPLWWKTLKQSSCKPFGRLGWPSGRYSCWDQGPLGARPQWKGHINKRLCLWGKTRAEKSGSIKSNQICFPMKSFTGQQRTRIQILRENRTQTRHLQTCKFIQTRSQRICSCVHAEISAPERYFGFLLCQPARMFDCFQMINQIQNVGSNKLTTT